MAQFGNNPTKAIGAAAVLTLASLGLPKADASDLDRGGATHQVTKQFLRGQGVELKLQGGGTVKFVQVDGNDRNGRIVNSTFAVSSIGGGDVNFSVVAGSRTNSGVTANNGTGKVTMPLTKADMNVFESGKDPMPSVQFSVTPANGATETVELNYHGSKVGWTHSINGVVAAQGTSDVNSFNAGGRNAPGYAAGRTYKEKNVLGQGDIKLSTGETIVLGASSQVAAK